MSIGMPTYNGERFIREALDSLLAQDYPNFELLISDNASTDRTSDITREYAARDDRVRVMRQAVNIGAPANFNFVFRETSGRYFMWAADDDRWDPGYIRACVDALELRPDAVLACTTIRFVDATGAPGFVEGAMDDNPDLSMASPLSRVRSLLSRGAWYQIYGLHRRHVLEQTRLAGASYGADVVLLIELALHGPIVLISKRLFEYRLFARRSEHDRGGWHASIADRERVRLAPYAYLQEAIAAAILRAPVGLGVKVRAWLGMVAAIFIDVTPWRQRIVHESEIRLRLAIEDRDIRGFIKFAVLIVLIRIYRSTGFLRRLV